MTISDDGIVKVLVVDDSSFARLSITKQLSSDPGIRIVGVARDGIEALEKIKGLKPDVITLDVEMPRMGGLETLERIMEEEPTPVVMLSSLTSKGAEITIRALEVGAIDFFLKSSRATATGFLGLTDELNIKVKLAAKVKAERFKIAKRNIDNRHQAEKAERTAASRLCESDKVVVIGSSTGGPAALYKLIPNLPDDLHASFLVVQHLPSSFTRSLAERLDQLSQMEVKEARPGDRLNRGQVLLAPGGYHMIVKNGDTVELNKEEAVMGLRPAVDVTMRSVASVYGSETIGVVLTGMGSDGTKGAALIKAAGGEIIVQDADTCVIYGMPRSVVESGNADKIMPLPQIPEEIASMCHNGRETRED